MSKWVPFTAHIKVFPGQWLGLDTPDYEKLRRRLAVWRDMQKIAQFIYEGVESYSPSTINVASPGGGQHRSFAGTDKAGFSGLVNGTAVVPQFGNKPALAQITGFYKTESTNAFTYGNVQRFNGGDIDSGPAPHANLVMPTTTIDTEVKALKTSLEAAINGSLPANYDYDVFRIDYSGVVYGDRGYHFPR